MGECCRGRVPRVEGAEVGVHVASDDEGRPVGGERCAVPLPGVVAGQGSQRRGGTGSRPTDAVVRAEECSAERQFRGGTGGGELGFVTGHLRLYVVRDVLVRVQGLSQDLGKQGEH